MYKVRWNPFHERTFISASADWTTKIWNSDSEGPVMSFDLNQVMVDVVWSPFNSAVFIALSLMKAYVYNLENDRHTRAADVKPTSFDKLTNVAFNPKDPIFLIGDCKGQVGVFKLSQDLAKRSLSLTQPLSIPSTKSSWTKKKRRWRLCCIWATSTETTSRTQSNPKLTNLYTRESSESLQPEQLASLGRRVYRTVL